MAKKSAKPRDVNSMAARIVAQATDPEDQGDAPKDAARAAGGSKGGHVRAERMTAQERSDAAKKAVSARWATKDN